MRRTLLVVTLVAWTGLALVVEAQTVTPLTIHNVTLQEATSTLTITGVGFGTAPAVTVDGEPVTVLSGGSDTQVRVLDPAPLATTPSTYRLTVSDPQHQAGDVFVVATGAGMVSAISAPPTTTRPGSSGAGPGKQSVAWGTADSSIVGEPVVNAGGGGGLGLIEDPGSPYRTAIGYQALFSNQAGGIFNTAAGYGASFSNTTGSENTGLGTFTLYYNTIGNYNTASGYQALTFNTTASFNTASGAYALNSNTTGSSNTASGYQGLYSNTTGHSNTASGYQGLYSNTTGHNNTGTGTVALNANTTGYWNVAVGAGALYRNTAGFWNTATGTEALHENTTGHANTAVGVGALYGNVAGSNNAALGLNAGHHATAGSHNVFVGADVQGEADDTNTMRLGLTFDGSAGQNRTFIAGIYGTVVSGGVPVVIDSNGQLGVQAPPVSGGVTPAAAPTSGLTPEDRGQMAAMVTIVEAQQASIRELVGTVADERATIAALQATLAAQQARLARLEALVPPGRR